MNRREFLKGMAALYILIFGIITGALLSHIIQPQFNVGWRYYGMTLYARYAHQNLIDNPELIDKLEAIGFTNQWLEGQWVEYYDYLLKSIWRDYE